MAEKVRQMIDAIILHQSSGNPTVAKLTKTKLILKGINPDKVIDNPVDDPVIIAKLEALALELGVKL